MQAAANRHAKLPRPRQWPWSLTFHFPLDTKHHLLFSHKFLLEPLKVSELTLRGAVLTACEFSLFVQHFDFTQSYWRQTDTTCSGPRAHLSLYDTHIIESDDHRSCVDLVHNQASISRSYSIIRPTRVVVLANTSFSESVNPVYRRRRWPNLTCLRFEERCSNFRVFNRTLVTLRKAAPRRASLVVVSNRTRFGGSDQSVVQFPILRKVCGVDLHSFSLKTSVYFVQHLPYSRALRKIDLQNKLCESRKPRSTQFNFNSGFSKLRKQKREVEVDFSRNGLKSVPHFQLTGCPNKNPSFEVSLNLSRNILSSSEMPDVLLEGTELCRVKIISLDLSHNKLSQGEADQFLVLKHLQKLHLDHNKYTKLPVFYQTRCARHTRDCVRIFTLRNLEALEFLDMSHNPVGNLANPFFYPTFYSSWPATLQKIDLSHCNFSGVFHKLYSVFLQGESKHKAKCSPKFSEKLVVDLTFNQITSLAPKVWMRKSLYDKIMWCEPLLTLEIDFEGNPINCMDSQTVITYEYLVSESRSLVPGRHSLPDFSRYENNLKCSHPPKWRRIPLMQIPEVEFSKLYTDQLESVCPDGCYCYHSWRLGDVDVANCTPTDSAPLTQFPQLGNQTTASVLVLAHNKLEHLCIYGEIMVTQTYLLWMSAQIIWSKCVEVCLPT